MKKSQTLSAMVICALLFISSNSNADGVNIFRGFVSTLSANEQAVPKNSPESMSAQKGEDRTALGIGLEKPEDSQK